MRVRMRTTMAGPSLNAGAGTVVDIDEATAKELIARGYAASLADKAVVSPVETATATPQRRNKQA